MEDLQQYELIHQSLYGLDNADYAFNQNSGAHVELEHYKDVLYAYEISDGVYYDINKKEAIHNPWRVDADVFYNHFKLVSNDDEYLLKGL